MFKRRWTTETGQPTLGFKWLWLLPRMYKSNHLSNILMIGVARLTTDSTFNTVHFEYIARSQKKLSQDT